MATIQLGNTKVASKLLSYAEKRATVREGVNCPEEYAKAQFKATRELWGKTKGIQAHHVIQSFKPGEVSPELANEIGQDLAREIAPGHECVVYTHTDKNHIHNHIVINSVSFEDGSKYQSSKKDLYRIREQSDRLCYERGLSVIQEPSSQVRYTLAEKSVLEKGKTSWKDEIRQVVDLEKQKVSSYEELKANLTEKYGIEVRERGQSISYKHPDVKRFVRGKTLGLAYERGTLEHELSRQIEPSEERRNTEISSSYEYNDRTESNATGHGGTNKDFGRSEILSSSSNGQGINSKQDVERTNSRDLHNYSKDIRGNEFNLDRAREQIDSIARQEIEGFERGHETSSDSTRTVISSSRSEHKQDGRDPEAEQRRIKEDKERHQHEYERDDDYDIDF